MSTALAAFPALPRPAHGTSFVNRRGAAVTAVVVAVHVAAVWALGQQTPAPPQGLIQDAEIVMMPAPAAAPEPAPAPPAPPPPRTPPRAQRTPPPAPAPAPTPTPTPAPSPDPVPSPMSQTAPAQSDAAPAATAIRATGPASPKAPTTHVAAPAGPAQPASPSVVLPSADADYLDNPRPAYPRLSKRLGEQGTVLVRVLISTDGRAEQAELRRSSGFERLDQAALETVRRWRYVPGRVNGQPAALWFQIPIHFVLE